jgi:hypothetical protein
VADEELSEVDGRSNGEENGSKVDFLVDRPAGIAVSGDWGAMPAKEKLKPAEFTKRDRVRSKSGNIGGGVATTASRRLLTSSMRACACFDKWYGFAEV